MSVKNSGFKYVPAYDGDEGLVEHFQEGSAQTFVAGDPVLLSGGKVVIYSATPLGAVALLGFAEKPASGVTDTLIPVRIPRPSDLFIAQLDSGGTFAPATHVQLTGYDLKRSGAAGTVWVVDTATATNPKVIVIGSLEYDATGIGRPTAGGSVYVKFKNASATLVFAN